MSKIKKVSAVIMALALVLCVGYFSMMSTTSAWFYNSGVIDSEDSFVFGDLSVDTSFKAKSKILFDGATKLADKDEFLFDEVIHIEEITVCNSGTIPARIYADALVSGKTDGFRWFFFSDADVVDGSVKKTIEASLTELSAKALDNYNLGQDSASGKYIYLNPGEITTVKIASWVEYDAVEAELENGTAEPYNVEFTLIATQDVDAPIER